MGEVIWRKYPEHPIEVSSRGEVRSLAWGKKRVLRAWPNNVGYLMVSWYRSRVRYTSTVHRLVLLSFVGPRPPKMEARHLDGDKTNNAASNLAWGTKVENQQDAVRHGTRAGLTKEQAAEVVELLGAGVPQRRIAEQYGVSQPAICRIGRGLSHADVGPPQEPAA